MKNSRAQQFEIEEKPTKIVRSITMPDEIVERLERFRKNENRSFSNAVVTIVKRYLDNYVA